ncbi:hypothetical protein C8J57DRAFT_1312694 [Mycena rebaudengoi]|nr:hypothetical protein C8J57DRAFT_1312694 [Mycena rebaudengoi]
MHSKQLAHDFLAALTGNDAEKLSALVTDDFTHQVLPASMGFPTLNKEQWIQTELRLSAVFSNGKFEEPSEIIVADNAIVFHTKAHGSTNTGIEINNEFIYILRINSDGKISSTTQFVDAKEADKFVPLMK